MRFGRGCNAVHQRSRRARRDVYKNAYSHTLFFSILNNTLSTLILIFPHQLPPQLLNRLNKQLKMSSVYMLNDVDELGEWPFPASTPHTVPRWKR